jgi:GTPase
MIHFVGKSGQHSYVKVPLGTIVKDENGEIIFNFKENSSKFVVARGGRGGKGTTH